MNFYDFVSNVEAWGEKHDFVKPENAAKQLLKIVEELGEVTNSFLKQKPEAEKDGIGDLMVTIALYCKIRDINIDECMGLAWEQIKDRNIKNVNGTLVKEEDWNNQ